MNSLRSILAALFALALTAIALAVFATVGLAVLGFAALAGAAGFLASRLAGSRRRPAAATRDRQGERVWNDGRGVIIDIEPASRA